MKIKVSGRLETKKNIVKTVYGGFRCKNRTTILVTGINVPPATIFFLIMHTKKFLLEHLPDYFLNKTEKRT